MNIRRRKVVGHRIQNGEAIVDIVFYDANKSLSDRPPVKWVGDAYKLREEINSVIADLERKQHR